MRDRETYLRMQLDELLRAYRKQAEPIISELGRIEASKPPRPIIISTASLDPTLLPDWIKEEMKNDPTT